MKIKTQVAIIAAAPLIFLWIGMLYGLLGGWSQNLTVSVIIALTMMLASAGVSYMLARAISRNASRATKTSEGADAAQKKLTALDRSQAVIEFDIDGKVVAANENFLQLMGYRLEDIQGRHHSLFLDDVQKEGSGYRSFWDNLRRGEFQSGEFKRVNRDGDEVWLQASYNPILDGTGAPVKVVKFASDITASKSKSTEATFKSAAFSDSSVAMMTVDRDFIVTYVNEATKRLLRENVDVFRTLWPSFDPDNIIGTCIDQFHKKPGHQRQMLADPSRLPLQTEITIGDFKFALNVSAVFDENRAYAGNVLEWADVTQARKNSGMLDALDRSQAVIEFDLNGTIVDANENFLAVMGYSLGEIKGKHHSMFATDEFKSSADYATFWDALRRGDYRSDEFQQVGKGGKEVWIQASYNPILDGNGKPFKVVKFASDITEIVIQRRRDEAERKERSEALDLVVDNLASGMKSLASGDLTSRINVEFTSEFEQLRRDFNETVDQLHQVMTTIISTAEGITSGASEISKSADDLSRRTEDQAGTLEQTAAALDQITATVSQTSSGANEANAVAAETRTGAQQSGEVVREAVDAMGQIENSSNQISQIIGVIDDIAFQTNLLALNAGVEAARAGDAGRGFAVVAQEVRALAQRSSDAAKEIKGLISTSSQHVSTGVDLVNRAGESLEEIVGRVENVSNLVSEIAASAKEQSASLSEVNTAVNKMDKVTQQNAAMVEESTAASHSLTKDAADLSRLIAHFNTSGARRSDTVVSPVTGSVTQQQNLVATYAAAANGSAALKVEPQEAEDDWQEF